jgi:arginase family enzyme
LEQSGVHVVRWRDRRPEGDLESALVRLRAGGERVYVHLDLDALDPAIGSGVVDPPVPGGLSEPQLLELLGKVRERFDVLAATIATFTPSKDDGSTLPAARSAILALMDKN